MAGAYSSMTVVGGLLMMGTLLVALRWTFGTGRSLPVPNPDDPTGDGLLAEVSRVPTRAAAQVLHARLDAAGVRATIGRADGEYRVLVFRDDMATARLVLNHGAPG